MPTVKFFACLDLERKNSFFNRVLSVSMLLLCCSGSLHHVDPFAVRADPGRAVADPPFVFFEAGGAYLKSAAAVPAEGLFLFAAVAAKLFFATTATLGFRVVGCHRITRS